MKRKLLSLLAISVMTIQAGLAQQPYGNCMKPDDLRTWSPETDPEIKFNRSTVPLRARFYDDGIKANTAQFYSGKVAACLTMNPNCSTTPSQGANNFTGYNHTYWQYLDILVWWGGSAGEGIITPPSAPVVDIAHLHGVKVLGCIFFPEQAHGGDPAWALQMLTNENGQYPYALKLYQMAKELGFDGWFINAEGGTQSYGWSGFAKAFMDAAKADGNGHMEIQLYNQDTEISSVSSAVKYDGVSFMANYGSWRTIENNRNTIVRTLGLSENAVFEKVYSGVENAQGGLYGGNREFNQIFPISGHKTSIQLFNPEEPIWKTPVRSIWNTSNNNGSRAYAAMQTVFNNENTFWVNNSSDPTASRKSNVWPGLSSAIQERSAITSVPFVTSFSYGLGKKRFVAGEERNQQDWYHRGMQDVLPTWRWWITVDGPGNRSNISYKIDFDNSYNAGTCIEASGQLHGGAKYLTRLYKTKLLMSGNEEFSLVYKTQTPNVVKVKLATSDNVTSFHEFSLTQQRVDNGWTVATADLSSLRGKTVSIIALEYSSDTDVMPFSLKLGQLGIMRKGYAPTAEPVRNLRTLNRLGETTSNIRLVWDRPTNTTDIHHFNIYREVGGVKKLVGQTRNEGFYIPDFTNQPGTAAEKVFVATVTQDRKEGALQELSINYPGLRQPDVTLLASKTLIGINESVTITARANRQPQTYAWETPEGARLVSTSGNQAVFTFTRPGTYSITARVSNAAGTTTQTVQEFIEVASETTLQNVARNKEIHSYIGSTNQAEHPRNLIDGTEVPRSVNQKWCNGGKKEHWVIIDLKAFYMLYQFKFFDCRLKEREFENIEHYRIEVSSNAVDWTEVLHERDKGSQDTKDAWIKPTPARYVRFKPYSDNAPITIRIWEFQAFGKPLNTGYTLSRVTSPMELNINTTTKFSGTYSLGTREQRSDFKLNVRIADSNIAEATNIQVSGGNYSFDITAKAKGQTTATIELVNAGLTESYEITIAVEDPNNKNLVRGRTPIVEFFEGATTYDDHPYLNGLSKNPQTISDGDRKTTFILPYLDRTQKSIHTLTYDLETLHEIKALNSYCNNHSWLSLFDHFELYVSETTNEESSYTKVLDKESGILSNEFKLDQPIRARFLKIKLRHRDTNYNVAIDEIEVYGRKIEEAPAKHVITLTESNQGYIRVFGPTDLSAVEPNTTITIAAYANEGFLVRNIYIDNVAVFDTPQSMDVLTYQATVNSNMTIRAEFSPRPIDVLVSEDISNGRITISGLSISETEGAAGDVITITAHPDPGYKLQSIYYTNSSLQRTDITQTKQFVLREAVNIHATFIVDTSVTDISKTNIRLYPNPADRYVTVSGAEGTRLRLYTVNGVLVLDTELYDAETRIDLNGITAGTYVVAIGDVTTKLYVR